MGRVVMESVNSNERRGTKKSSKETLQVAVRRERREVRILPHRRTGRRADAVEIRRLSFAVLLQFRGTKCARRTRSRTA